MHPEPNSPDPTLARDLLAAAAATIVLIVLIEATLVALHLVGLS